MPAGSLRRAIWLDVSQVEKCTPFQYELIKIDRSAEFAQIRRFFFGRIFAPMIRMLDLLSIAATLIFFLISLAYVRGCDKL